MKIFKMPKMDKDEIEGLIREQRICRIAFRGEEYPYMAPFQYVFINGSLYFHFTNYGRKMKLLDKDRKVCVEIEKYQPDMSEYGFVTLRGTLKVVTDPRERAEVISRMVEEAKQKLSENFLAVHGFNKDDGWSVLRPEKPLVIVKLDEVNEKTGLRSP
jgi:nitroimidazol reductase NimA-like FMN-containing flavoprotein (pyridoxamine 5'-phosphate oxidase superfamily)